MQISIRDFDRNVSFKGTEPRQATLDELIAHVGGGAVMSKQVEFTCDEEFFTAIKEHLGELLVPTSGSHGRPTYRDVPIRVGG